MADIDILSIDADIKYKFEKEQTKLEIYRSKSVTVERALRKCALSHRAEVSLERLRDELACKIDDIATRRSYNFYVMETADILDGFRTMLSKPIRMSFVGRARCDNHEKQTLVRSYIRIARQHVCVPDEFLAGKQSATCANCQNKRNFDIDGNIWICMECGVEKKHISHSSSYKDVDRVNITTKYTYDRKVHFRDCVNQYQGKQNSTIDRRVYDDLEEQFDLHGLLRGDETSSREERFSEIELDHVYIFLKETEHTKHYEDAVLIHHKMTGKKPENISHLEDALLSDFDVLTVLYDKKFKKERKIDRKNFINTQYVLFQLLRRHRHPCRKEEFNILKTIDRKSFHDDICKELFNDLGWNFTPCF